MPTPLSVKLNSPNAVICADERIKIGGVEGDDGVRPRVEARLCEIKCHKGRQCDAQQQSHHDHRALIGLQRWTLLIAADLCGTYAWRSMRRIPDVRMGSHP